jgi:ribosomal protein S27AE
VKSREHAIDDVLEFAGNEICVNCGHTGDEHESRGFCGRCHVLVCTLKKETYQEPEAASE